MAIFLNWSRVMRRDCQAHLDMLLESAGGFQKRLEEFQVVGGAISWLTVIFSLLLWYFIAPVEGLVWISVAAPLGLVMLVVSFYSYHFHLKRYAMPEDLETLLNKMEAAISILQKSEATNSQEVRRLRSLLNQQSERVDLVGLGKLFSGIRVVMA